MLLSSIETDDESQRVLPFHITPLQLQNRIRAEARAVARIYETTGERTGD